MGYLLSLLDRDLIPVWSVLVLITAWVEPPPTFGVLGIPICFHSQTFLSHLKLQAKGGKRGFIALILQCAVYLQNPFKSDVSRSDESARKIHGLLCGSCSVF